MAVCTKDQLVLPDGRTYAAATCPTGYLITDGDMPNGTVLATGGTPDNATCAQTGLFGDTSTPNPRCRRSGGSTYTMCPGAQVQNLVSQYNAKPQSLFMGAGVCVDSQRYYTAVQQPGCQYPTQCVFQATSADGKTPTTPKPTDFPGYSCSYVGGSGRCLQDTFVCDMDLGLCRHASQDVKNQGPKGVTSLADCQSSCPAKKFSCTDGKCVPDDKGTLDYVQCTTDTTLAPTCAAAAGAMYKCDPQNGCVQSTDGDFKGIEACQKGCVSRCVYDTCIMSPDTTMPACTPDCGSGSGSGGNTSGGGTGTGSGPDPTTIVIIVVVGLFVVGVAVVVWYRFWHKKKSTATAEVAGAPASPADLPAPTSAPPTAAATAQQLRMRW